MVTALNEPRNALGILLMAAGFLTFSIVDAAAKFLTGEFHPVQIVWIRQLGFLVFVFWMLLRTGPKVLKSACPGLQITRGCLAVLSATSFIWAVSYIPLADAVAITFVAPFFVVVLGSFWLRETVGVRRWTAVFLGFAGSLIVIRPGLGVMHPAAFLLLFAAFAFSLRQILSRILGAVDSTATTVAYSALVGSALVTLPLPFVWITPWTPHQLGLMAMIAVLAGIAEFLIIRALELAEAVAVAPVHYTMMLWGTLWGWLVFGELPDVWTWVGAAVIIISGVYTIYREKLRNRRPIAPAGKV